jgi:hypothetical protein
MATLRPFRINPIRLLALWLIALLLASLSVFVERRGPDLVQYGNLCGQSGDEPCTRPALSGGFPLPFLFDVPGISVENQLAFFEDDFAPAAFVFDCVAYALATGLLFHVVRRSVRRDAA